MLSVHACGPRLHVHRAARRTPRQKCTGSSCLRGTDERLFSAWPSVVQSQVLSSCFPPNPGSRQCAQGHLPTFPPLCSKPHSWPQPLPSTPLPSTPLPMHILPCWVPVPSTCSCVGRAEGTPLCCTRLLTRGLSSFLHMPCLLPLAFIKCFSVSQASQCSLESTRLVITESETPRQPRSVSHLSFRTQREAECPEGKDRRVQRVPRRSYAGILLFIEVTQSYSLRPQEVGAITVLILEIRIFLHREVG